MAARHLGPAAPSASASIWWPRQMPNSGVPLARISRITGTAYSPVARGSPGPFERNTPSGRWRMTSWSSSLSRGHGDAAALIARQRRCCAWRRSRWRRREARRRLAAWKPAPSCQRVSSRLGLARRCFLGEVHALEAGQAAASAISASASKRPSGVAMTPSGAPPSRIAAVRGGCPPAQAHEIVLLQPGVEMLGACASSRAR